jgi:hypothetical protein
MKSYFLLVIFLLTNVCLLSAQKTLTEKQKKDISSLINKYSEAREKRDTALLKTILTSDVDQLVSTGEWRNGINESVQGMLRSSSTSPGTRTLIIDKIRMLDQTTSIIDCIYQIKNDDGSTRKMWSTFIIISDKGIWKISAIRNMLPSTS